MHAVIRFFKNLYPAPFHAALVISFTLVAAVAFGIGTWVISYTINSYLSEAMDERVARDIRLAETFYSTRLDEISGVAGQLALAPAVIENITAARHGNESALQTMRAELSSRIPGLSSGNHFIAILDAEGKILTGCQAETGGTWSPVNAGSNWANLPIVRQSLLERNQIAATEVIPVEFLEQVGLAEQARILLIDTPRASPLPFDPREGTAALALVSVAPILDAEGQTIGIAMAFHMFNNDFTLVDQIKTTAQVDSVTIFLGDLRVSTNIMTAAGERAIGTRLAETVGQVVLRDGREYVGPAFVVNENYITRYEPIRDHTGQVVGILYAGARQALFLRLLTTFNQRIALVAAATILMTFLLASPVARAITRPLKELRELVQASQLVTQGDLTARVSVRAGGEVGQLENSFNTMLDTLQATQDQLMHKEKLASLGQLAAGVAHELNNPLGTILLYSESMTNECAEDDPRRADLKMIVSETKRCKRIVADLLNFARHQQVMAQPTDVNEILREISELSPRYIKTVNIPIVTELDPRLPLIEADAAQLRQVFRNLMINAVEAMPEGGRLTVRTRPGPRGMITVEIQDTGAGIPPENLAKLFTPFFTTKPVGKGTGLGLAISYGIIKMHRGQVNVQSQIGKGATFTVTLPIQLPAPEIAAAPSQNNTEGLIG